MTTTVAFARICTATILTAASLSASAQQWGRPQHFQSPPVTAGSTPMFMGRPHYAPPQYNPPPQYYPPAFNNTQRPIMSMPQQYITPNAGATQMYPWGATPQTIPQYHWR